MPPRTKPAAHFPDLEPVSYLLQTAPANTAERLAHVRALGRRIDGYIKFICSADGRSGYSLEARDKVVAIFYERLRAFEQELAHLHEEFQLL